MSKSLPPRPDLDWLRKTAKERLAQLRASDPAAKLNQAQHALAQDYGFSSWRALKAHVDAQGLDSEIIRATIDGRAQDLAALLNEHPAKLNITGGAFNRPLLHLAAEAGHTACATLLLHRGFDVNTRDRLDHATALHWAAEAGKLDMVRQLLDAGADPDGDGDMHEIGVIGWATALHTMRGDVAELLLSRGARPTIFSAVALDRADLVRKLHDEDPDALEATQSRFEQHRTPLHLAVLKNLPQMVSLLIELGADVSVRNDRD